MATISKLPTPPGWIKSHLLTGKQPHHSQQDPPGTTASRVLFVACAFAVWREAHSHPILRLWRRRKRGLRQLRSQTCIARSLRDHQHLLYSTALAYLQDQQRRRWAIGCRIAILYCAQIAAGKLLRYHPVRFLALRGGYVGSHRFVG